MIETMSNSNDQIFNILFDNDEITWQSMIYDLVSSEKMDPWDVDVSLLAAKFLEKLKEIKQMDLNISGKVLLAAAILLRVKSYRFMDEDMGALDALIANANSPEESEFFEDLVDYEQGGAINLDDKPQIFPRTPQPRKRKVSVFDLVNALEKALDVYKRRPAKIQEPTKMRVPEKKRDISLVIRDVYKKVTDHFGSLGKKAPKLTFSLLLNNTDKNKDDKLFTFIPLLHLDHQRKLELTQEEHFGEININLLKNTVSVKN